MINRLRLCHLKSFAVIVIYGASLESKSHSYQIFPVLRPVTLKYIHFASLFAWKISILCDSSIQTLREGVHLLSFDGINRYVSHDGI